MKARELQTKKDGGNYQWFEIKYHTGLPEDRCKEIQDWFIERMKR